LELKQILVYLAIIQKSVSVQLFLASRDDIQMGMNLGKEVIRKHGLCKKYSVMMLDGTVFYFQLLLTLGSF
jgi:hypothetical protein